MNPWLGFKCASRSSRGDPGGPGERGGARELYPGVGDDILRNVVGDGGG